MHNVSHFALLNKSNSISKININIIIMIRINVIIIIIIIISRIITNKLQLNFVPRYDNENESAVFGAHNVTTKTDHKHI